MVNLIFAMPTGGEVEDKVWTTAVDLIISNVVKAELAPRFCNASKDLSLAELGATTVTTAVHALEDQVECCSQPAQDFLVAMRDKKMVLFLSLGEKEEVDLQLFVIICCEIELDKVSDAREDRHQCIVPVKRLNFFELANFMLFCIVRDKDKISRLQIVKEKVQLGLLIFCEETMEREAQNLILEVLDEFRGQTIILFLYSKSAILVPFHRAIIEFYVGSGGVPHLDGQL